MNGPAVIFLNTRKTISATSQHKSYRYILAGFEHGVLTSSEDFADYALFRRPV
jgi:hypothetical protein